MPPARSVTLTGYVDDVRPWVARAWASVVPLRIGGGTRLKILEAMALGTPVVATSKGAEGLDVRHGEHDPSAMGLIAAGPSAFAGQVAQLLRDACGWPFRLRTTTNWEWNEGARGQRSFHSPFVVVLWRGDRLTDRLGRQTIGVPLYPRVTTQDSRIQLRQGETRKALVVHAIQNRQSRIPNRNTFIVGRPSSG